MSDFALMAVLPFRALEVGRYPVNEMAMAALIILCLFRRPRGGSSLPPFVSLSFCALLLLLVYSGYMNDVEGTRRVGHVAILAGIVWAFGTGRVSLRSAGVGLTCGLVTVMSMAVVGVGGDNYPGRLTGFLADPNAGAYFVSVLGVLAIFFSDDRRHVRIAVAIPLLAGLVLTYSRTGLLASAFAIGWVLVGRRLGVVRGAVSAAGLVWLVSNIPDDVTTFGPFSNRSGSDALRNRIIAQEQVELADMPWFGHGPGSATVNIRGLDFFFHNSYLAVRQEGGWLALLLVLGVMLYAFIRLSGPAQLGELHAAGAQAAIISVAVMGITLGEVLLELPMAVAVGFALGQSLRGDRMVAADA